MRKLYLSVLLTAACILILPLSAFSQESKPTLRMFTVTIVETRLSEQVPLQLKRTMSADEVLAATQDSSQVEWSETIQCSVLEGHTTHVTFGRTVSVFTGMAETPRGKTRNMAGQPVGTSISVALAPVNDKFAMELEYQSSRLSGDNDGEPPPPEVEKNQYKSSLRLDLAKTKIIASTPNSYLLIRIDSDSN